MDDYNLIPQATSIDCLYEVFKLKEEAEELTDAVLIERISFLFGTFECLPITERIISKYFQSGDLTLIDRQHLEATYVSMYGIYALGDDGKIVTTVLKG